MKKITLLLMLFSLAILANATVILDELFDYDVANLLDETSWMHNAAGTITAGTGRTIESDGLVYTNAGGAYALSGLGKKINHDYGGGLSYISYKKFPSVSTGEIYLSFLYHAVLDQGQGASEIIGLSYKTDNSTVKPWAGKQAAGTRNPFRFGVSRSTTSSADIQWSLGLYEKTNVYLMVVKYDFNAQKASLFVNPQIASASEPTPDTFDDIKSIAPDSLTYLMFKNHGASIAKFLISGVRVSTTWAEAVAPQSNAGRLATPNVSPASEVSAKGSTANWTPVANAVGYDIRVYKGAEYVKVFSVSGQSTASLVISGLQPETTYTYKVIAKGDIEHFNDSAPSEASASFTTDVLSGLNNTSTSKLIVSGKTIAASEVGIFEIYNLQGAKVYHVKNVSTVNTNLATGLYILQYTDLMGRKLTQKVAIN